MMTDQRFQELKCAATGALSYEVTISESAERTIVVTRRVLPTDGLPDFARVLTRAGLTLTETLDWSSPTADGHRIADVALAFTGQPLKMTGQLTMAAVGCDTTCTLRAELKAGVPLFGARIEQATAPVIERALDTEQGLGQKWLTEHP